MSDFSYAPMLPPAATRLIASDPESIARSLLLSCALHALLGLLMVYAAQRQLPPPARRSIHAVLIAPTVRQGAQTTDIAPVMPAASAPTTPSPATTKPKPLSKTAPQAPAQADAQSAKPPKTPSPAKPEPTRAEVREPSLQESKANAATSPTATDKAGADTDEDGDSLLSQLRGNWLAPPRSAPIFGCRLRISYRAGGIVTAVVIHEGCGDRALTESVERAVWKTQPLPLPAGSSPAGTIDIEFSP